MARAFTLALCLVSAAGLASSRRLQSTQGGECYLVEKVSGKELLPGQNWESLQVCATNGTRRLDWHACALTSSLWAMF